MAPVLIRKALVNLSTRFLSSMQAQLQLIQIGNKILELIKQEARNV